MIAVMIDGRYGAELYAASCTRIASVLIERYALLFHTD